MYMLCYITRLWSYGGHVGCRSWLSILCSELWQILCVGLLLAYMQLCVTAWAGVPDAAFSVKGSVCV
jgi:hypothetical protein